MVILPCNIIFFFTKNNRVSKILSEERGTPLHFLSFQFTQLIPTNNLKEEGTVYIETRIMGRLSKEYLEMQKRQLGFLLEEETVQKRLKVCDNLVQSILKTRSGPRKNEYKQKLQNVHQFFCVKVYDHEALKKKYAELEKRLERSERKRVELSDHCVRLEMRQKY